jgi:hypothetical protein
MNSKRLFFLLTASLVILVGLCLATVYLGNSMLKAQSSKLYDLKKESLSLDEQQRILVQAKKDIEKYKETETIARTVVPQEKDQARTVREIIGIANRSGVDIANIAFPSSTLGSAVSKDKKKKTTDESKTQLEPVEGTPGVYRLEVNVQTDTATFVPFSTMLTFLRELEQNRRTSQVSSLTITPDEDRNLITFNLVLNVYIR